LSPNRANFKRAEFDKFKSVTAQNLRVNLDDKFANLPAKFNLYKMLSNLFDYVKELRVARF